MLWIIKCLKLPPLISAPIGRIVQSWAPLISAPIGRVVPSWAPLISAPIGRIVPSWAPLISAPIGPIEVGTCLHLLLYPAAHAVAVEEPAAPIVRPLHIIFPATMFLTPMPPRWCLVRGRASSHHRLRVDQGVGRSLDSGHILSINSYFEPWRKPRELLRVFTNKKVCETGGSSPPTHGNFPWENEVLLQTNGNGGFLLNFQTTIPSIPPFYSHYQPLSINPFSLLNPPKN